MGEANEDKDILKLQEGLQSLQAAFDDMVEKRNKREVQQMLTNLEGCKAKVKPPDLLQLPEHLCDEPVAVDPTELRRELKKRMKLLEILIMKVDCPVSKVVDEL